MQQKKEESTKSHKEFFEKRDELSNQISLLDKECFRLKTQSEKIEENREARITYMWEEYEITPNNALTYRKEEMNDRHVMKQQIHKLKDEIRALGSVNVNAIEDYRELLERHTFLRKPWSRSLRNLMRECGNSSVRNSERSRRNLTGHSRSFSAEAGEHWSLQKMKTFWKQASGSFPSLQARSSRT